jgi:Arc/MetJ family transcription regulator
MATNLTLDDRLLNRAMKIGSMRAKRDTVTAALKEFIQRRTQKNILALEGKVSYRPDWDYKNDRRAREPGR